MNASTVHEGSHVSQHYPNRPRSCLSKQDINETFLQWNLLPNFRLLSRSDKGLCCTYLLRAGCSEFCTTGVNLLSGGPPTGFLCSSYALTCHNMPICLCLLTRDHQMEWNNVSQHQQVSCMYRRRQRVRYSTHIYSSNRLCRTPESCKSARIPVSALASESTCSRPHQRRRCR